MKMSRSEHEPSQRRGIVRAPRRCPLRGARTGRSGPARAARRLQPVTALLLTAEEFPGELGEFRGGVRGRRRGTNTDDNRLTLTGTVRECPVLVQVIDFWPNQPENGSWTR